MNNFGTNFRISIFGESHGVGVGIVINGCPAGIPINENDFIQDINRRKTGATGTSKRIESDKIKIISGIYNGFTTGLPIALIFENSNTKSSDYKDFSDTPRPSHADFVAEKKWKGFQDLRGGGHFSGRLTLPLVATGVIAKKIIHPIDISAKIVEIGGEKDIESALEKAYENTDSIGGIVECEASNMPIGLGEPFFNSVESLISHLLFSIPAIKGIEFGNGFEATKLSGSVNNDAFVSADGKTSTNNSGGINGGISNGNNLYFRVAVKPASSTPQIQKTLNFSKNEMEDFIINGRHDLCIALRVPIIIEAVTAIVLADLMLTNGIH